MRQPKPLVQVSGFSGVLAFSLRAYGLCRSRNANPDMVRVALSQSNNVLGASVLQFGLGSATAMAATTPLISVA